MSKPKKYYLGLIFEPNMEDGLHVTHCYFGTMSLEKVAIVRAEVSRFFHLFGPVIYLPRMLFNVPAQFGPENNIRVLLTSTPQKLEKLAPLRRYFLKNKLMQEPNHPYRPHVTTNELGWVEKPFLEYVLVASGVIEARWPVREEQIPNG